MRGDVLLARPVEDQVVCPCVGVRDEGAGGPLCKAPPRQAVVDQDYRASLDGCGAGDGRSCWPQETTRVAVLRTDPNPQEPPGSSVPDLRAAQEQAPGRGRWPRRRAPRTHPSETRAGSRAGCRVLRWRSRPRGTQAPTRRSKTTRSRCRTCSGGSSASRPGPESVRPACR